MNRYLLAEAIPLVNFLLKSDSNLPKKFLFICFNEKPLKMMKNAFYFISQALFLLKIFKFLSWHFSQVEETGLIRKIRLISKLLTSQPGWQTITIHILPNISRSKGNQTLKCGQVIEYINRNISLPKSCRTWGRETSSCPFFVF